MQAGISKAVQAMGRQVAGRSAEGTSAQDERTRSVAIGSSLLLFGVWRAMGHGGLLRRLSGLAVAASGGSMLYQTLNGQRPRSQGSSQGLSQNLSQGLSQGLSQAIPQRLTQLAQVLGVDTATGLGGRGAGEQATSAQRTVTIRASADDLARRWQDPATLAQVMGDFAEVTPGSNGRLHWVAALPNGETLTWDTETVENIAGERLRWQSLPDAALRNEGTITFRPATGDRGTVVTLHVRFEPPGGTAGLAATKLLHLVPSLLAEKALRRFKALIETGEVPTLTPQPAGNGRTK